MIIRKNRVRPEHYVTLKVVGGVGGGTSFTPPLFCKPATWWWRLAPFRRCFTSLIPQRRAGINLSSLEGEWLGWPTCVLAEIWTRYLANTRDMKPTHGAQGAMMVVNDEFRMALVRPMATPGEWGWRMADYCKSAASRCHSFSKPGCTMNDWHFEEDWKFIFLSKTDDREYGIAIAI